MSDKNTISNSEQIMSKTEYAFEAVPDSAKKSAVSLIAVLAGYLIAMSNFVTGAAIGSKMVFMDSLKALIASDIFLVAICLSCGMIAVKFGAVGCLLARNKRGHFCENDSPCCSRMASCCWYYSCYFNLSLAPVVGKRI